MITLVCLAALVGSTSAPELELKDPSFNYILFDANKVATVDSSLASCPKKGVCIEVQSSSTGINARVFQNNQLIAKGGQVGNINSVTEQNPMGFYLLLPGKNPKDFKSVSCGFQEK